MQQINIACSGAGWMGATLMQRLHEREDVNVVGLFQPDRAAAEETLQAAGLALDLWTDDYDALVQRSDVDAVFICSPNRFHGPQSLAAMKAGKHVFCEKPCATSFSDFLRQIELEQAHPGLIAYVDYILFFDPMEQKLRRMVADGAFGEITQIQINYRHPINIVGEKAWKLQVEVMGDAIGMGINHALSVMVYAMESQARPVRVYATSTPARVRGFEADPIWNIQVEFDNGASGCCFGNIDSSNGYDAYHTLYGSRGAFVFDSLLDQPQKVRFWSEELTGGDWVYPLDADRNPAHAWPADLATPDSGNVIEHQTSSCVNHFIECVKSGVASPLSFVNSATIAEIGWAALMSAQLRQPIDLPLDRERALGVLMRKDKE